MTPLQTIKDQMINRRLPYFVIKYNGKEIDRQDARITPGEAADQLENIINSLNYDRVQVEVSGKNKEDKGEGGNNKTFTHVVQCNVNNAAKSINGHESKSTGIELDTYLALVQEKSDLQRDNDKLTDKIKRLEESLSKVNDEDKTLLYIEKLGPYLSGIFGQSPVTRARPVSQALAGTPEQVSEQLSELMERWAKADKKKLLQTIEAIVLLAENDPGKYKFYQNALLA